MQLEVVLLLGQLRARSFAARNGLELFWAWAEIVPSRFRPGTLNRTGPNWYWKKKSGSMSCDCPFFCLPKQIIFPIVSYEFGNYMKKGLSVWLDVPLDALAKRIAQVGTASRPLLDQPCNDP